MDENDWGDDLPEADGDPYLALGVSPEATPSDIRAAYFRLVRSHPPERDPAGFKRIRAAYEALRSPRKQAELRLLKLRPGEAEFDLDRLHDAPAPSFPPQWLAHCIAMALAELEPEIDALVAAKRAAIRGRYANGR